MTPPLPQNNNDNNSSSTFVRAESSLSTTSNSAAAVWHDEMGATSDQLFFVTSYSNFGKLAHGPRGTNAVHPLSVYRFHPGDGSLVLLNVHGDAQQVVNPAFSRHHPRLNVVYTCTEDIERNGQIFAYSVGPHGQLRQLGDAVDAGGTSTCYLTLDRDERHLLAVNYWDSTLAVIPLDETTGALRGPIASMYDPKGGKTMVAAGRCRGGVNHSHNDDTTIRMRQADPHSHALVLDPFVGAVAYVPDLGKDLIREFLYNRHTGTIVQELNVLPSGLCSGMPDGPRYFEFHPKYNVAYVVNELSSTVAVFEVDRALLEEMADALKQDDNAVLSFKGRSTLRLIQSIKTIPSAFPTTLNTCGRICVHKSGRFVVVSNRGHQSIAVFRVCTKGSKRGELTAVGYHHTRGETPRHFQFDASGQYLLVANQDSDSIAVFNFNLSSGDIKYTGNEYRVPSPNFVCCCPVHDDDANEDHHHRNRTLVVADEQQQQQQREERRSRDDGNYVVETAPVETSSGTSSDSDDYSSTVPQVRSKEAQLKAELARAQEEIARLKKRLEETAMMSTTANNNSETTTATATTAAS